MTVTSPRSTIAILLLALLTMPAQSVAEYSEQALLLQISEELAWLQSLSRQGSEMVADGAVVKAVTEDGSEYNFDYHALETDLASMRQAILQHLMRPVRLPSNLAEEH